MGFYVWSVVDRDSNRHPQNTVAALTAALYMKWQTFPTSVSLLPALDFDSVRAEAIIAADDGFN